MRLEPQTSCGNVRVNPGFFPPVAFVTVAMNLAMMPSTECDNPLVADLSPKCAALREAQMMGIGRCAAADKARLGRDKSEMILVPNATRLGMGKFALVNGLYCMTCSS